VESALVLFLLEKAEGGAGGAAKIFAPFFYIPLFEDKDPRQRFQAIVVTQQQNKY
jgi:hypothetical protein